MDGLAQTSRGVLASALGLLVLGAALVGSLNDASPKKVVVDPPAAIPLSVASAGHASTMRVALTRRGQSSIRLRIETGYRIVPLDRPDAAVASSEPLAEARATVEASQLVFAGQRFPGGGIEIVPDTSPAIWIEGRKYRGTVRLYVTENKQVQAVNVLPLEEYIAAVVDAEMPGHFPSAAREAQAVVARTYAISCRRDPPHRWYDLHSTPVSQNYMGVVYEGSRGRLLAGETAGGRAAAAATQNLVCICDGALFRTYYSACCGGHTLSGDAVFHDDARALGAVPCGGCADAPLFRWSRTLPASSSTASLLKLARSRVPALRVIDSAKAIASLEAPSMVAVSDGRRTVRLPAVEVRSALGLPSLCFELEHGSHGITVEGRGHGHGVGLCQWGAKGLAERGLSSRDILRHYYPGCELAPLSAIEPLGTIEN